MVVIRNCFTDKELFLLSVMKVPSSFSQISLLGNFAKPFAKIEESLIRNTLIINTPIMFLGERFLKSPYWAFISVLCRKSFCCVGWPPCGSVEENEPNIF